MPFQPASDALSDLLVLDLTRVRAGPTCVRQLADWGADVVKIEMPAAKAEADGLGGPRDGADFQNLHRNKRSLTLDLKHPQGREVFLTLARRADVVVENFRPDVKDRLGIGYEALAALNPRLVYASVSGFGQTGPYRDRPGFDQVAQGLGGLMSITGLPGQGPVRAGIPLADLTAGLFGALGILTALHARVRTGRGQWVQTSLLQAQVAMLDFQAARWLVEGVVPGQAGNNHPTSIPTGVFATADGFMNIAATGNVIWRRCCRALGLETLAEDPDFATGAARSKNRDRLNGLIGEVIATADTATWVERLNAAGVPCGPIHAIDKVFADPQVRHLGIAQDVVAASGRELTLVGQPVALTETPSRLATASPELGQHSEEVLTEFGYDAEAVARLRAEGVV